MGEREFSGGGMEGGEGKGGRWVFGVEGEKGRGKGVFGGIVLVVLNQKVWEVELIMYLPASGDWSLGVGSANGNTYVFTAPPFDS